jgi:Tol biopolymer transport system component
MSLAAGSRLGPYEIVAPIGAGGMGEVFQARDTRLDRSVAIKILSSHLSSDPLLRERFDREARTISQLSHPNICTLHDVGHEDGVDYLVMELLEGESLADRLRKGPLPLADVLKFGAQIAEALDRAHRSGIVHRDLKPGNVMLTRSGAKLLDFGLASVGAGLGRGEGVLRTVEGTQATVARPLTQEGTILGTFQYMAPEQLEGVEADARTDIFALGAVLYEMTTGRRAFEGKTKTSLIAAIVSAAPRPLAETQPLTPPALEHVIAKCLEKDPEERWQNARDVAEELRWIGEAGSQAGVAAPVTGKRRRRENWLRAALAVAALAAVAFGVLFARERLAERPRFVASIPPPEGLNFNATGDTAGPIVISPDGRHVVFSAGNTAAAARLFVEPLDTGEPKEIPSTDGATFPFWSPDSKSIGFFQGGKLKRVDLRGGAPLDICPAANARGGTWGPGDVILFAPTTTTTIWRVSAAGGTPVPATKLDPNQHTTHRWPEFLEDGKHFVYLAANHRAPTSGANGLYVASIDGRENRRLMNSGSSAVNVSGFLFYVRDNVLFAQKLSRGATLENEPVAIASHALYDPGIWRSDVSISRTGVLVYNSGQATFGSTLAWFDRTGKKLGEVGTRDAYFDIHLSPDQKKLAMSVGDPGRQVSVYDFDRNVRTRVTFNSDYAGTPAWSPDGKTLYYSRVAGLSFAIVSQSASGGRVPRVIREMGPGSIATVEDISSDGKFLSLTTEGKTLILDAANGKSVLELQHARAAKFSPDGRWLAYRSDESSQNEIYITSFPDQRAKWQVSSGGGAIPLWRRDGRELFFYSERGQMMVAPITPAGDDLEIGDPQPLFEVPLKRSGGGAPVDVSADGQRFLVNVIGIDTGATVVLVSDWRTALARAH